MSPINNHTCDLLMGRMSKEVYVSKVNEVLESQRKEARDYIDSCIQDRTLEIDPKFHDKIYPIMVRSVVIPEGRKHLEAVVTALRTTKRTLSIREGTVCDPLIASMLGIMTGSNAHEKEFTMGCLSSKILGLEVAMKSKERSVYELYDGSWHDLPISTQEIFEHEIYHIAQIAKGTMKELQKVKSKRWSDDAEREAIEVENKLAAARGDPMRLTHQLIPNYQTKREEFYYAMMFGCDGNAEKLLKEWAKRSENLTEKDFDLLRMEPGFFAELLQSPEKSDNEVDRKFNFEKAEKKKKIFLCIIETLAASDNGDRVLSILEHLDVQARFWLSEQPMPKFKSKKIEFIYSVRLYREANVMKLLDESIKRAEYEMAKQVLDTKVNEMYVEEARRNLLINLLNPLVVKKMIRDILSEPMKQFGNVDNLFNLDEIDDDFIYKLGIFDSFPRAETEMDEKIVHEMQQRSKNIYNEILGAIARSGQIVRAEGLLDKVNAYQDDKHKRYTDLLNQMKPIKAELDLIGESIKNSLARKDNLDFISEREYLAQWHKLEERDHLEKRDS